MLEVCDSMDNDCDGLVDDDDDVVDGQYTTYTDADGDGYGILPVKSVPARFLKQTLKLAVIVMTTMLLLTQCRRGLPWY